MLPPSLSAADPTKGATYHGCMLPPLIAPQVSFSRYHEGRTRLQAMTAAWTAAACKALSFDGGSGAGAPAHTSMATEASRGANGCKASAPADRVEVAAEPSALRFRLEIVHLFSLLHALALQVGAGAGRRACMHTGAACRR